MAKRKRKSIPRRQRRTKQQRRDDDYLSPEAAPLVMAEWVAAENLDEARWQAKRADDAVAQRRSFMGGAPPTPEEIIARIRTMLRDLRRARPGEKDYKLYPFVARACGVSSGTVRKYDPNPTSRRKR